MMRIQSHDRRSPARGMRALLSLLLVLLVASTLPTTARADTLYQVEIVVFARDSGDGEDSLRSTSALHYPARTVALGPEGGAPFQSLPAANLQLNREAAALAQRKNLRVLAHQGWVWPGEDAAHATPVAIGAGRQVGAHHELEGYVALSADHFLRIDTQLWLSRFGGPGNGEPLALPNAPGAVDSGTDNAAPGQVFMLREQRRMRSGELHYFDNARLGMLLLVTPAGAAPAQ
jgi:hypothetical protein